ncbi:SIT4 phosphatase-associated protein [Rutstroemia sp. NJR-2017a BBW]|nr:SIT4 phosphatase-associated protein [Rutstroemia sp. NJR-2017a BBW]
MFWRFGGYANVSTIDTILDKEDVTLEELLDESDLIQELKSHNAKLIEYLREDKILQRLLEYVVAPKVETIASETPEASKEDPESLDSKGKARSISISRPSNDEDDEEREKKRNRYAYVAAEILSSDNWSICEALMENQPLLRKFWEFLNIPAPLDPLQASYFTKVNEALLDRKTEEMLDLFKSIDGAVRSILQHVDSPMIMDLLLKIISLEKAEGGQGIVDWLHSQDLMPILLSFLSSEHSWATQTSAGDFLKAIITISANASQNEASCIGPNELTRQLVSQPCIEKLISDMLKGGNPLTVGVGIVIEVIRKNNSDYDPEVGADATAVPSSRDPIYLGTLLRMFAQHVPDFMDLILSPNHTVGGGDGPVTIQRKELNAAFGGKIEPLGFDRFKTCELMAELLHCSNMGLLNEIGSEEFVKARDLERERLKAEGKLDPSPSGLASEDDLTMKSSTQTRLGSPDGSRKLEVQNASDDDGFEEVTHSADLGDDPKDDFDEKHEADESLLNSSQPPVSFLDKDDEEFVDEPLSSPRLQPADEQFPDPEMTVLPLSPTKELSQQVGSLGFSEEDTTMTSPPPSIDANAYDEHETSSDGSQKHTPGSSEDSTDLTHSNPEQDSEKSESTESGQDLTHTETLVVPLPEDTPAPLFSKKSESPSQNIPAPDAPQVDNNMSVESVDTTMGDAGDSSHSIMMGNTEEHHPESTVEASGAPVVGDYLKMQFVEHKVVPTILDFFFRFPWNNFLHNVVYDVVQQVFNGPMDRGFNRSLAIDLFETGDITMRIVDGQKKSDEAQEKNKMRLGYMGHLTLIAEEVVKFTERHPPELLSDSVFQRVMNGDWVTYVEVTLAETRERDNAILGGVRPDMAVGPRQAVMNAVNAASNFGNASSALAEAGLNGSTALDSIDLANSNNGNGANFITGGTLLSGFGSSSDEEDDEMDEDNDEEGKNSSGGTAAEVGQSVPPSAPNLDKFDDELDVDYEYLEQLDRDSPLFPPGKGENVNLLPLYKHTIHHNVDIGSFTSLAARLALHSKQKSLNGDKEEDKEERGINPFKVEGEDDDDEDGNSSDEEYGRSDFDRGFDDNFEDGDAIGVSATREAKRRTSLEDDDDVDGEEGVVHVGMVEEVGEEHEKGKDTQTGDDGEGDGELVEIQHAEMQGMEGGNKEHARPLGGTYLIAEQAKSTGVADNVLDVLSHHDFKSSNNSARFALPVFYMPGIVSQIPFTCSRCLRALRQRNAVSCLNKASSRRFSQLSPLGKENDGKAAAMSEDASSIEAQILSQASKGNDTDKPAQKEQGAMSRRLAEATEDALFEGGRAGRKAVEEAGFSEELKARLLDRVESAKFKSENASAFAEANLTSNVGRGSRDIATGQGWTGTENTEDAVLRMLDDARKPLKPGLRGPAKIPSPVVDLRLNRQAKQRPGQRLANARDKTSVYAIAKDANMTEQEREEMRKELKERFTPGARPMPNSIRGLAALANERIEDAIARGQFKNIPRGKAIERDTRADNPFIDTTEYIMNKMIQRQDIVPPWIEKQQELVKTANAFRARLRNDWKRQAARTIASRGGTLEEQMQAAERYAQSEAFYNPKRRAVEQISVPTNATDDAVMVRITQQAPSSSSSRTPAVQISLETKDTGVKIAEAETVESTTSIPAQPASAPLPPPFRIPSWEAAEQSYLHLAIGDLNSKTRSYNLMAPDLAKKPYFSLDRELKACYADVAPLLAGEIRDRATRPTKEFVEKIGHREGGIMERFGRDSVTVYDSKRPLYGFKEFWNDLFGGKGG